MKVKLLNITTVILLIILPYVLFQGKLYIGGDDTRLFYAYPFEFFRNVSFFSWYNVSSVGLNVANQYLTPFLTVWSFLLFLVKSRVILSYFAFSLPLILGIIFFQKFVKELLNLENRYNLQLFIGSLFYVLSPILIINQLFIFLTAMWLMGLIPLMCFLFLRYLKTSSFLYIYIALFVSFIFSFTLLTIPWIGGFLLPIFGGLLVLAFLSKRKEVFYFLKKLGIFTTWIVFSQAFWLIGFLEPFIFVDRNSLANKFVSKGFLDTFDPTILSTATGNIFYPLLNIFHRQIPFDFGWQLKYVFLNFYDKTFIINILYIIILFLGIFNFRKILKSKNQKIFIFLFVSFLISLYCFTVNIGPLKDLFLVFKYIPGFVMFRNFFDKFAIGFVFIYAVLFSMCLIILEKRYKKLSLLLSFPLLLLIVFNFLTVKDTVDSPLWTTNSTYKNITIPEEYLETMSYIKSRVSPTNTILSIPFGSSVYTVIKDKNSNSVYVGTSPVKIFSGVNDISGHLSFNFTKEADTIDKIIIDEKYDEFKNIMYTHNINYVLVTKNIPEEVKKAWIFDSNMLQKQNQFFVNSIVDKKIYTSRLGNYDLYSVKKPNTLLSSDNLYFEKINNTKYKLFIKNLKSSQVLTFNDTFNNDWKLFLRSNPDISFCKVLSQNSINKSHECRSDFQYAQWEDISFLWGNTIFDSTHGLVNGFSNKWTVDPRLIKKNYPASFYKTNKDGSIDIELVLYFKQQSYFYVGLTISCLVFIFATIYLFLMHRKNEKKH